MAERPFLAKVAVGAAIFVLEEGRKLPSIAATIPTAALAQAAQLSLHVQQFIAELAAIGDQFFESYEATEETPKWATFDEPEQAPTLTIVPGQ